MHCFSVYTKVLEFFFKYPIILPRIKDLCKVIGFNKSLFPDFFTLFKTKK